MISTNFISGSLIGTDYQVKVIKSIEDVYRMQKQWNNLVEEAQFDHPFMRHEWTTIWWESFNNGNQLYLMVIEKHGKTAAIVPLMLRETRMYGIRIRSLESLYNPHTPRYDFIVCHEDSETLYRVIWQYLLSHADEWDILKLSQLLAESYTVQVLPKLAMNDGYLVGFWHGEKSPYVPFSENWETYFKSLRRKHRSNLRNRLNRLHRLGDVKLETIVDGKALDNDLDMGFRIEAAAWKEKTDTAIISSPDVHEFYRKYAAKAAAEDVLRLIFLTVGGVRIAFAYALEYKNRLFVLKTGYDPEYAAYSPYNILCFLLFQDCFKKGLIGYEFLGANENWKLEWTNITIPHDWVFVISTRWYARIVYTIKFQVLPVVKRRLRSVNKISSRSTAIPRLKNILRKAT